MRGRAENLMIPQKREDVGRVLARLRFVRASTLHDVNAYLIQQNPAFFVLHESSAS